MTVEVVNRQRLLRVDSRLIKKLATHALEFIGATGRNLSIVLVNDEQIAVLNARYHKIEGPTDILSFDYGEGQGELIVSVEHALAQARRYRTTPSRELALYLVHGILHLEGYDDRTPAKRRRMQAAERHVLTHLETVASRNKLVGRLVKA